MEYRNDIIEIEGWDVLNIFYKIENISGISYFFWYIDGSDLEFRVPYILITSKYKGDKVSFIKDFLNNCIEKYKLMKSENYKDEELENFYAEILKFYKNKI